MPDPHRPWHSLFDVQHRLDRLPSPLKECGVLAYERLTRTALLIPAALLACARLLHAAGPQWVALLSILAVFLISFPLSVMSARRRAGRIDDATAIGLSALYVRSVLLYAGICTLTLGSLRGLIQSTCQVDLFGYLPLVVLNHAAEEALGVLIYCLNKTPPRKKATLNLRLPQPLMLSAPIRVTR